MWASPCDADLAVGGGGLQSHPPILLYIISRSTYMKHLSRMFSLCTLATAFHTFYCMKTAMMHDAGPLCIMHFIIQSALLDYSFLSLILVCYVRLVYCMSNYQIVAIALMSLVKDILLSAALVKLQACVASK